MIEKISARDMSLLVFVIVARVNEHDKVPLIARVVKDLRNKIAVRQAETFRAQLSLQRLLGLNIGVCADRVWRHGVRSATRKIVAREF